MIGCSSATTNYRSVLGQLCVQGLISGLAIDRLDLWFANRFDYPPMLVNVNDVMIAGKVCARVYINKNVCERHLVARDGNTLENTGKIGMKII